RLIEASGWAPQDSLVLSLAVYATLTSPAGAADAGRLAAALSRLEDTELALDMAGVVFAFNAVNRVADARRVQLEYRFLRELRPLRGWMERRFATLTGLVYDLSYVHQPRRSSDLVLAGLGPVFQRLGASGVPGFLRRLERSPPVLEGISELILANARDAEVNPDLWREAIAIAVASRAMYDSCLVPIVDRCLSRAPSPGAKSLLSRATESISASGPDISSAFRR